MKALTSRVFVCLMATLLALSAVRAQSTWTPNNSNWNASGNWSAGVPETSTSTAIFGNSGVLSVSRGGSVNHLGLLQFTSAAPSYTITGNDMDLWGVSGVGIINDSGNTQTLGFAVDLFANQQWQANAGTLVFTQRVGLGASNLSLSGAGNVTFSGTVDSSGGTFTKTGSGTLTIQGGSFQPNSTIQNGLVNVNTTASNAFEGGLTIGGTSSSAQVRLSTNDRIFQYGTNHIRENGVLNLNGFNQSLANVSFTGGTVQSGVGLFTYTGSGIVTNASTSSATITGRLAVTQNQSNFQVADGSAVIDLDVNATLAASTGFTKSGAGTMRVSQSVTTGGSDIYNNQIRISGGTLLMGASNIIADNAPIQFNGGTLATGGNSDTVGRVTLSANSTLDLGSGSSVMRFADSSSIPYEWASGRTISVTNWSGSLTGGGTDRVYFGTSGSGLTAGQIAQIQFVNPAGLSPGTYGAIMLSTGEIVPYAVVPETGVALAGVLLGLVAIGRRRRFGRSP